MQPSAVRAQLSFEHWQDTQLIAGLREGPASPERLVFNATVPRPLRRTLTTLTLPLTTLTLTADPLTTPWRSLLTLALTVTLVLTLTLTTDPDPCPSPHPGTAARAHRPLPLRSVQLPELAHQRRRPGMLLC